MKHPGEDNLALLAGGETGRFHRFLLDRHVRDCEDCQEKVAEFQDSAQASGRGGTSGYELEFSGGGDARQYPPGPRSGGMRPRYSCIEELAAEHWRRVRGCVCASLLMLVGASVFFTDAGLHRLNVAEAATSGVAADGVPESSFAKARTVLRLSGSPGSAHGSDGKRAGSDRGAVYK